MAARQAQREAGKKPRGPEPQPPSATPLPKDQFNFTDPESRIMKAGSGDHFEQAYNAQAAVDTESLLIVGARVSDAPNDKEQLVPTLAAVPASLGPMRTVMVDTGVFSEAAVRAVEGEARPMTVYAALERQSHHRGVSDLEQRPEPEPPPAGAGVREKLAMSC
ncbi:MAG: hypothetical protein QOE70_3899 [Chthoniobacter sp.]|nr:hypothetical protein [Chthoniobacter sp.]